MKHKRRIIAARAGTVLFAIASLVSVVLCAATLVLWVRSRSVTDQFGWRSDHRQGFIASGAGQIRLHRARGIPLHPPYADHFDFRNVRPAIDGRRWFPPGTTFERSRAGFRLIVGADQGVRYRELFVPHWALIAATATLPAWWGLSRMRRRRIDQRHRQGRCRRCGYDLRATRTECPECGLGTSAAYGRPEKSERAAVGGVLLILIAAGWGIWWSVPRVPDAPARPPPAGLATWPVWAPARPSAEPTRMLDRDEWGYVTYRGIWQSGSGSVLVVLRPLASRPWGQPFDVLVFDRSLRLVRSGRVTAHHGDRPYRLAEVYSTDSLFLPRPYRSKWILSIEFWPAAQPYIPSSPPSEAIGGQAMRYVHTEPVEWSDVPEPDRFTTDIGRLQSATAQIRHAEAP